MHLYDSQRDRCEAAASYLVEHGTTIREAARHFGISKSTVHKDIRERLKRVNMRLYVEATKILDKNKSERHIRGGIATRNKYIELKNKNNKL